MKYVIKQFLLGCFGLLLGTAGVFCVTVLMLISPTEIIPMAVKMAGLFFATVATLAGLALSIIGFGRCMDP